MLNGDNALQDLMVAMREDTQARAKELTRLNEQLEERNRLLEQQLGRRINGARWFSLLAVVASLVVGVWVYMLVLNLGQGVNGMSQKMDQMQGYLKNMAVREPIQGDEGYISSMAHDIHRMSEDIAVVRAEMQQVSSDIGIMRAATTDMRADIGGMTQSLSHMSRNVRRLSRDAQNMGEPFRGMMPW